MKIEIDKDDLATVCRSLVETEGGTALWQRMAQAWLCAKDEERMKTEDEEPPHLHRGDMILHATHGEGQIFSVSTNGEYMAAHFRLAGGQTYARAFHRSKLL